MKKIHITTLKIVGLLFIIVALLFAGKLDYTEQVIQTLSNEQYWKIVEDIGGSASDTKIADHYMKNRKYYDSIR